jgi:hypothetical protein
LVLLASLINATVERIPKDKSNSLDGVNAFPSSIEGDFWKEERKEVPLRSVPLLLDPRREYFIFLFS